MTQDEQEQKQATGVGGDIWEQLKRGSATASDAAQRIMQIHRINAKIRGLKAKRRKTIYTVGEKVYALHTKGKVRNKDVLESCQSIDELVQQEEEFKEEIESIREESRNIGIDADELMDDAFLTDEAEGEEESVVEVEVVEDELSEEPAESSTADEPQPLAAPWADEVADEPDIELSDPDDEDVQ